MASFYFLITSCKTTFEIAISVFTRLPWVLCRVQFHKNAAAPYRLSILDTEMTTPQEYTALALKAKITSKEKII